MYGTFYGGYMFPLLVKEELDFWPEQNLRHRTWMNVKEAGDVCRHWWMKEARGVQNSGIKLVLASLQSETVLTDVFLGQKARKNDSE
ncbi:hypothetical protein V6N11_070584 [Hibiscus sabdariffa]|uniref:Uncharacterized protein n=1 Tax=Hibiscus sabdariffa TaxID=183260 RepID=A0ABR2QFH6_9ROSI